jgi:hypothetical protein
MARSIEQWLSAVRALTTPDELRATLALDRPAAGIVIAAVAKRIVELGQDALAPDLADAFTRLPDAKRDPGSRGKIAIARALHELDHWDDRVFVTGLSIVQHESGDDTAAELRGVCGLAHAHFARADALDVLPQLLADEARITRIAAAQALGDSGRPDATALLRYKLLHNSDDPEVLAACCESLLALARDTSITFLVSLLARHDLRAESAALALGGARATDAVEPLARWCDGCRPEQRHRIGYLALALLRSDDANAHLVDAMRTRARADAVAAARALATFKADPAIDRLLRDTIAALEDKVARREIEAILAT